MAELTKQEMLRIVDENISRLKNKDFNLYFFVLDTKGNPTSSLEYIYQTALVLHKKGYNVSLLHQENDFVGGISATLDYKHNKMNVIDNCLTWLKNE